MLSSSKTRDAQWNVCSALPVRTSHDDVIPSNLYLEHHVFFGAADLKDNWNNRYLECVEMTQYPRIKLSN
jgi:hypothetical protein